METKKIIPTLWLLTSLGVCAIVCLMHFPEGSWWESLLPQQGHYHFVMMLTGAVLALSIALICCLISRFIKPRKTVFLIVSLIFFLLQVIVIHSYYFHTDWDVQQLYGAAKSLAEGNPVDDYVFYFRENANNQFLMRLFAAYFFITGPLWGCEVSLFTLLILQCVAAWLSGVMLLQVAMHLWHSKSLALTVWLLYILLVMFSPWWSIPYSDVWGLFLIVTVTWTAFAAPITSRPTRVAIITALCTAGYYIKPQVVLVGMALLIVAISESHWSNIRAGFWRAAKAILAGLAIGLIVVHLAMIGNTMHLHSPQSFGATHFLMMGANSESIGIYSASDVDFSRNSGGRSQRRRAELAETVRRYREMGFQETLRLWSRKNLLNFSDGTFYWGREGSFYKEIPQHQGPLASLTRDIYYTRPEGRHFQAWSTSATALWFGILLLSLLAALPGNHPSAMQVLMLCLMMITLFHTLFEARSRYLFCFTPLFILVAAHGIMRCLPDKTKPSNR